MSATLATAASGRELIPGDPDEVEALAARLAALGEGLSEAAARLVDLDDGGWRGPAAEAFRATLGDQPQRYAVAGEAFAAATVALRRYAGVVSDAQAEGDRAIEWWREGEAATGAWERAWSSHDAEVARRRASTELAIVAGAADLLRPSLVDPGAEWRQRALSTLDAATAAVDHEAAATATALAAAEQGAPSEPSFWSRLWAGLSGFADGLWASTGGAGLEIVGAVLDDPGGFVSDAWDNAVDHLNVFDWDTFADTWAETGKDLVAWDDWAAGNPARALGRIAGNVVMGAGTGKVALRLLRGRKHQGGGRPSRDVREAIERTPEENRRLIERFDDAPAYERIFRDDRSDRHILGGEGKGKGGHRARTGRPGKHEFPEAWSDQRILDAVDTAAQNPVREWRRKDFPNGNTNFSYVG
ncbi:MAG: EndoU domain-containing protein, partial [Actinobacteria bacterium]|nr:EndoU domain-containing protein [Actinomycetota bacterium]